MLPAFNIPLHNRGLWSFAEIFSKWVNLLWCYKECTYFSMGEVTVIINNLKYLHEKYKKFLA